MASATRTMRPAASRPTTSLPCAKQQCANASSDIPVSADLLQKYGVNDAQQQEAVEALVRGTNTFGNSHLLNGLHAMFKGMSRAVDVHTEMTNEIHLLHEGILTLRKEVSDAREQLSTAEAMAQQHIEVPQHSSLHTNTTATLTHVIRQEQCRLASAEHDIAITEIARIESIIQEKDYEIERSNTENLRLLMKMQELEGQLATLRTKTETQQEELTRLRTSCASIEQQLIEVSTELSTRKQHQLSSLPGAPFFDPVTRTAMLCPVLQSNGHLVPLKTVIDQWLAAASPHDGYMHRTYICPIMQVHTNLASVATQERIRQIAQHAGIDTAMPLAFGYQSETGEYTEFEFYDQLGIISKICAINAMQLAERVEQAIIQHGTLIIEINTHRAQVKRVCIFLNQQQPKQSHQKGCWQDGELHIQCFVERLDTRTRYNVNAILTHHPRDQWDPMGEHRIRIH